MAGDFDLSETALLREQLFADGFLSIEDFVTAADIEEVRALLSPYIDAESPSAMPAGVAANDIGEGLEGGDKILELVGMVATQPDLTQTRFFKKAMAYSTAMLGRGVRYRFDHVIDKSPQNDQPTPWHQDCACSSPITLSARKLHWWLPLQPATVENGCMQFVRGSHAGRIMRHEAYGVAGARRRTIDIPAAEVVACPLPVGGVTIHMPKTLHYTGPNTTSERRTAWIVHMGVRAWPPRLL